MNQKSFRYSREYVSEFVSQICSTNELPLFDFTRKENVEVEKIFEQIRKADTKLSWQSCGKRAIHLPQLESLCNLVVETFDIIRNPKEFVILELGAGKGLFGQILEMLCGGQLQVISIDRRKTNQDDSVGHVRVDLESCDLENLITEQIDSECRTSVVVIAKHLCGPGTDLAVEAINRLYQTKSNHWKLKGAILAPCCHSKCDLDHFQGLDSLHRWRLLADEMSEMRFNDFATLLQLVTLSGFGANLRESDCSSWRCLREEVPEVWRLRQIADKARRLLEGARLEALAQGGLTQIRLCCYTSRHVTPNCYALLATSPEVRLSDCLQDPTPANERSPGGMPLPTPTNEEAPCGVIIRFPGGGEQSGNKTDSTPEKMLEYLFECRCAGNSEVVQRSLQGTLVTAHIVHLCLPTSNPISVERAVFARAPFGRTLPLLLALSKDPLILRHAAGLYPVTNAMSLQSPTPHTGASQTDISTSDVSSAFADLPSPLRVLQAPAGLGLDKRLQGICTACVASTPSHISHSVFPIPSACDTPDDRSSQTTATCQGSLEMNGNPCESTVECQCPKLSPTQYSDTLVGVCVLDSLDWVPRPFQQTPATLYWSVVHRMEWDPKEWHAKAETATWHQCRAWELRERFGIPLCVGTSVKGIGKYGDTTNGFHSFLCDTLKCVPSFKSATNQVLISETVEDKSYLTHKLLLSDMDVAEGAWVILRVRWKACGNKRTKLKEDKHYLSSVMRREIVDLLSGWMYQIQVQHLLTDKEQERTVIGKIKHDSRIAM